MHKENIFDLFNEQNPAPDPAATVPDNVVTAAEAKTDPIPAEQPKQEEPAAQQEQPEEPAPETVEGGATDGSEHSTV